MSKVRAMIVVGLLAFVAACVPGTPKQYIQPDDMEDILVDYYMAKALAQQGEGSFNEKEYRTALYMEAVLKKHGVSQEVFDSSLVYYYTRADRFDAVFQRVSDRLDEQALVLGASEGEIGKYAQYDTTGDTANIWIDRNKALLLPAPPYNRWEFNIEGDSTFRRGDRLMLMFVSDYMFQSGLKSGVAYLAVDYGDTVMSSNVHFSTSGLNQLRLNEDTTRTMKSIKGFFYLDGGSEKTTTTRLLFLNNVQLIRFHTKPADYEPTDSLARNSAGGQLSKDSIGGGDSIRTGSEVLPLDSGIAKYRVDARRDSVAPRL